MTIRFIDTKVAFCITLLSGMVAGSFQTGVAVHHGRVHAVFFWIFISLIVVSLFLCLRVIFPVIKVKDTPQSVSPRELPKFFIHQSQEHHWIRHTFSNAPDNVLSDDQASISAVMTNATDADLVLSMCNQLLTVSLIRQMKSDRLHAAMFSMMAAVVLFFTTMIT